MTTGSSEACELMDINEARCSTTTGKEGCLLLNLKLIKDIVDIKIKTEEQETEINKLAEENEILKKTLSTLLDKVAEEANIVIVSSKFAIRNERTAERIVLMKHYYQSSGVGLLLEKIRSEIRAASKKNAKYSSLMTKESNEACVLRDVYGNWRSKTTGKEYYLLLVEMTSESSEALELKTVYKTRRSTTTGSEHYLILDQMTAGESDACVLNDIYGTWPTTSGKVHCLILVEMTSESRDAWELIAFNKARRAISLELAQTSIELMKKLETETVIEQIVFEEWSECLKADNKTLNEHVKELREKISQSGTCRETAACV